MKKFYQILFTLLVNVALCSTYISCVTSEVALGQDLYYSDEKEISQLCSQLDMDYRINSEKNGYCYGKPGFKSLERIITDKDFIDNQLLQRIQKNMVCIDWCKQNKENCIATLKVLNSGDYKVANLLISKFQNDKWLHSLQTWKRYDEQLAAYNYAKRQRAINAFTTFTKQTGRDLQNIGNIYHRGY